MEPDKTHKPAFTNFLLADNREGSGKASSYVRALDLLSEMLKVRDYGFRDCMRIWSVNSLERLQELLDIGSEQTREWKLFVTYDAAFDRHLISLDKDYRLILSKDLKDHYTGESVRKWFHQREGEKITLPARFPPSQVFLETHRKTGGF